MNVINTLHCNFELNRRIFFGWFSDRGKLNKFNLIFSFEWNYGKFKWSVKIIIITVNNTMYWWFLLIEFMEQSTICPLFMHLSFDVAWSLGLRSVTYTKILKSERAHTVVYKTSVSHFKVKLIDRLKTQVGRKSWKEILFEWPQWYSTKASPTTSHSPSSGMLSLSTPHTTPPRARNKCSPSWCRLTSLDHATNYQIGKADQSAEDAWGPIAFTRKLF